VFHSRFWTGSRYRVTSSPAMVHNYGPTAVCVEHGVTTGALKLQDWTKMDDDFNHVQFCVVHPSPPFFSPRSPMSFSAISVKLLLQRRRSAALLQVTGVKDATTVTIATEWRRPMMLMTFSSVCDVDVTTILTATPSATATGLIYDNIRAINAINLVHIGYGARQSPSVH